MKQCSDRLSLIRVPHDFSRMVRGLDDLKHWKGSICIAIQEMFNFYACLYTYLALEFHSWLLYYSLPVIHGVLPESLFTHYTLLVAALHILLSMSISHSDLRRATCYLY